MSVTKLSSLCKCLASTKFGSRVTMCLPARVVAKSATATTASKDTINLCVTSLTTGKVFATSPCGARTTIEEIILNLSVWGEEERKRIILASSRERADILYPLKWKSIVLAFNNFLHNLRCNLLLTTTLFFFFMKTIFIFEIPVRRKMLGVSQATNILIIQP